MESRIKEIAKEKGVTIAALAEKIEITQPSMSNIVNGKINPKIETLEKIAEALGVAITDLFKKSSDEDVGAIRIGDDTHAINSKEDIKKLAEKL